MYHLHIANKNYSSWSLRPWILMTELGIPFEERLHFFEPGSNRAAFRGFSPTGKVPCLVDDGVAIWESLGITEYLAERHDGVWPSDRASRAWARSAAAEMHAGFPVLRDICAMSCGIRVRLHAISPALQAELDRLDELWTEGIERHGGPFLAGDHFTAVDAFFAPIAFRFQTYGLRLDAVSTAYVDRLLALDGMRAWYAAGLAETSREPAHEADTRRFGIWLEDLRAPEA